MISLPRVAQSCSSMNSAHVLRRRRGVGRVPARVVIYILISKQMVNNFRRYLHKYTLVFCVLEYACMCVRACVHACVCVLRRQLQARLFAAEILR